MMIILTPLQFKQAGRKRISRWLRKGYSIKVAR
jgi:hypothetical protein